MEKIQEKTILRTSILFTPKECGFQLFWLVVLLEFFRGRKCEQKSPKQKTKYTQNMIKIWKTKIQTLRNISAENPLRR